MGDCFGNVLMHHRPPLFEGLSNYAMKIRRQNSAFGNFDRISLEFPRSPSFDPAPPNLLAHLAEGLFRHAYAKQPLRYRSVLPFSWWLSVRILRVSAVCFVVLAVHDDSGIVVESSDIAMDGGFGFWHRQDTHLRIATSLAAPCAVGFTV